MFLTIVFRTIFFYLIVVISYKIMGKREVGELGVFDFIISMLISQLIAICIENYKDPIWFVIVPTLILVLFQIVFSFLSLKSNKFRDILDGKESLIISNGKLNFSEMKKQKYNLNDLLLQLRDKGIRTIEEVDYAILETNGKLSVFQKQDDNNNVFPLPLVLDGVIEENNLKFIDKTRKWLNNELCKKKINLDNIFYAFYKDDEIYVIENEN